MKTFIKLNLICVFVIGLAMLNPNDAKAQHQRRVTLKNTSHSTPANDVHLLTLHNRKFLHGEAPGFNPNNGVFPMGDSTRLDWFSVADTTPIAPGASIVLTITFKGGDGGLDRDSCYLTAGGVRDTTRESYVDISFNMSGPNTGNITFTNEDNTQPWDLLGIQLWSDNPVDPLAGPSFSPTGINAHIPAAFTLPPGGSQTFSYSFTNPAFYVGVDYHAQPSGNTGEDYHESDSDLQSDTIPASSIPTLSQWGIISLSILVLGMGLFFVRKAVV